MSTRFAILSDVHLTLPGAPKDSSRFVHVPEVARAAAAQVDSLRADRVVLLGDIMNLGLPDEYALARDVFARLAGRLEPLVGNHDVLHSTTAEFAAFWGAEACREATLGGLPALFLSSGIDGLPYSQWHGQLGDRQLAFLDRFLAAHAGRAVLVFSHHPLTGTVLASDEEMMSLTDSAELRGRLEAHGQSVVLFTGHTHCRDLHTAAGRLTCIGCPALCEPPHAWLLVDVEGTTLRVSSVAADGATEQIALLDLA